ncbi:MAG TPA: cytochrome c [Acetobacteraceae bacterium]|nr:cytochrome c [Acetobacteraceae bacterium]
MHRFLAALAVLLLLPLAARAAPEAALVKRGEYLTRAADCAACHTAPGGQPFTGGRAFTLPFGTLYAPNITPDPTTGIGGYTDAQWLRVLHEGVARDGKHLYPAMPYPSYTRMTDGDALAIKAYLMTLTPVHAPAPPNRMRFPFNQRWLMMFWNLVNNPDARFQPQSDQSAAWNRGAYLVGALGHCGECHTPRNFMQAVSGREFAGTTQAGWFAYNITNDKVHGVGGWSDAALAQYLSIGQAPGHGPASGAMAEAVSDSLRYLTSDDIHAIIAYLRQVPARADGPEAVPATVTPGKTTPLGARIFIEACAGCHLPNGEGRQSPWAALAGAQSLADPKATNIVQVLMGGTEVETRQGRMFMHSFAAAYTDEELAAVANYVIGQIGGRTGSVTPEQIRAARPATSPERVAKAGS